MENKYRGVTYDNWKLQIFLRFAFATRLFKHGLDFCSNCHIRPSI